MEPKMVTPNYSHTLLYSWRRCRYRFHLSYIKGIRGKAGLGMIKGSAGHAALAHYLQHGDADKAVARAWQSFDSSMLQNGLTYGENEQAGWEELIEGLGRYFEWAEKNDDLTLIKPELKFKIDFNGETLKGYIDAIVEDNRTGAVWLMEHKFNKRVYTKHLDLDPQVGIYMLAATLLDYAPEGVMYNIIRMGGGPTAKKEPVVRKLLYKNPEGLAEVGRGVQAQITEIDSWLQLPEEDRPMYRNPTRDCSWDCSFYNVCLAIEDDGDAEPAIVMLKKENLR